MEHVAWTDDMLAERFDAIDQRFDGVDQRFDTIERRFDSLDERLELRFAAIDRQLAEVGRRFKESDQRSGRLEVQLSQVQDGILQLNATLFRFCSAIVFALIGVIGAILVNGA